MSIQVSAAAPLGGNSGLWQAAPLRLLGLLFSSAPDLVSQSIDVVLNQRSCMLVVLRIIEENIPEVRTGDGGGASPPSLLSAGFLFMLGFIPAAAIPEPEQQQALPPR